MSTPRLPPLYPIVNVRDHGQAERDRVFALALELAGAGATLLQLRAKPLGAGALADLASRLLERLEGSAVQLIVNDRLDVALACGAAGVHLGDEDLPVGPARRVVLESSAGRHSPHDEADFLIGYSTHSPDEAARAQAEPADYLGFGPVFESPTKAGVRAARGIELLAKACRASRLPVVAIGGIALANARQCWEAGAASVAVISEIESSADRHALVAQYLRVAREAGVVSERN
ncbi:MAG: thiamine phosphate synthase [Candidatus Binatia bacterium]